MDTIPDRLAAIRARIAAAAIAAGRAPGSVTLVAVSKTHSAAAVQEAIDAGQLRFGENRVQEAAGKFPELRVHAALELHLIGPLQTNKARDAVRVADIIETLDRPKLLTALADATQREGRVSRLLIQVNVGDEPQKAGISRGDTPGFIAAARAEFGDAVTGLMCIPPVDADPVPHFRWLAACAAEYGLVDVSMGMSGDYELAIAHGATHVRIGSALFGTRPPLALSLT